MKDAEKKNLGKNNFCSDIYKATIATKLKCFVQHFSFLQLIAHSIELFAKISLIFVLSLSVCHCSCFYLLPLTFHLYHHLHANLWTWSHLEPHFVHSTALSPTILFYHCSIKYVGWLSKHLLSHSMSAIYMKQVK